MAISVNNVYQTVLAILNKEQRGYMTPNEFNRIAAQVQLEIYESYFPDGDQANRKNQNNIQNDTTWFNSFDNAVTDLEPFIYRDATYTYNNTTGIPFYQLTNATLNALDGRIVKQIGNVEITYNSRFKLVASGVITTSVYEKVSKKDFNKITRSKLTIPDKKNPVYYIDIFDAVNPKIRITPTDAGVVTSELIFQPKNPNWNYVPNQFGAYQYVANGSQDFELNIAEQSNVILRVLLYAGVVIRDPQIIQVAASEIQQEEVNEKS